MSVILRRNCQFFRPGRCGGKGPGLCAMQHFALHKGAEHVCSDRTLPDPLDGSAGQWTGPHAALGPARPADRPL